MREGATLLLSVSFKLIVRFACWHSNMAFCLYPPPSLPLHISLSLNKIRERSWWMWTVIFPDILKWIGQYTSKNVEAIKMCLNGWITNRVGVMEQVGMGPIDFSFCIVLVPAPLPLYSPPSPIWNKSQETLEGNRDSDIGFCKSNETAAALFHLTWKTGYKRGNSPPLAKKSRPWHENTLPNRFTSAPAQTQPLNS